MDFFRYQDGKLYVEDVAVERIAGEAGTPAFIYSKATFEHHLRRIQQAYRELDTTVCFSVKACGNVHVLRLMASLGSGFDIVSGGELYRVRQAGGDPAKVVYAGVGKTDEEILDALKAGIGYFNIESEQELENLIRLVERNAPSARPKAALRVNPDVDYKTHAFLTTGKKETKFGVDIERALAVFDRYGGNPFVRLCAVHVHLGTGGKTIDPYVNAVQKILPVIDTLRKRGHTVEMLDLGGGYGADYETETVPSADEYAGGIVPLLKGKDLKLILEPGKSICANAGILLTRVLYTKQGGSKKFIIVDAGMNDLIRPSLYDAYHHIHPVVKNRRGTVIADVVGPICESGDFLARDRQLQRVKKGEYLAVMSAGAYGFSMSSNYNSRPRPAEVMVKGTEYALIRKRETYSDLMRQEIQPGFI